MASYIVRIELFGSPSWNVYNQLHKAMELRGFARTIKVKTGEVFEMPSATYYRETTADLDSVDTDAKNAANSVWSDNGTLSVQSAGILVNSLREQGGRRTLLGLG